LALVLALAGCERVDRATWAAQNKILLLGNGSEPKALDPHLISAVNDSNIMIALFEGLVGHDPKSDDVDAPGAAHKWEHNEDYTIWTFYLRPDGRWSNGDPVTARDFVYAYRRILTPELGAPYSSMLFLLVNAEKYNTGDLKDFNQVGVKAIDDLTLQFTLNGPTQYFPQVVKHTTYLPVHQATIERFGKMTDQFTRWQRAGNHVGNGAFRLKSWEINKAVIVEPNPYHWDAKAVKLKQIHFIPISSEYTEERAFRSGLIHNTYTVPSTLIEWYDKNRPEVIHKNPYAGTYFYTINTNKKMADGSITPLSDKRIRRALALAIDRKAIVENITLGGQKPAYAYTPPIFGDSYTPPHGFEYDPEQARKLLAEAGYPNGRNAKGQELKFELFTNTLEAHVAIAEAVQDMWRKNLNLNGVTIRNQEWKVYQTSLRERRYDVARYAWIADFLYPTSFLHMYRSTDSNNETGWSSKEYDRLMAEADQAIDPAVRKAKMEQAETILVDELPIIPLYWYTRVMLMDPRVKNWNPLMLDHRDYKTIDLEP